MAIGTSKLIFLHIPKTAGTFVTTVLRDLENVELLGGQHSHFPDIIDKLNRRVFCFVRHPVTWYLSRFLFRVSTGWKLTHPLDFNCSSNNFELFIDNVIKHYPHGWLSQEYSSYIDTAPRDIFIGKFENLYDDFAFILNSCGYKITKKRLKSYGKINCNNIKMKINESTKLKILDLEQEVIKKYYDNYSLFV